MTLPEEIFPAQTTSSTTDGWLPQVCLPSPFNEVRRFIFNSAKYLIPFRIWSFSISDRAVYHADKCRSPWESHRVAVIPLSPTQWVTPVTREGCNSPERSALLPKQLHSDWSATYKEMKLNLFFAKCVALFAHKQADSRALIREPCSSCNSCKNTGNLTFPYFITLYLFILKVWINLDRIDS